MVIVSSRMDDEMLDRLDPEVRQRVSSDAEDGELKSHVVVTGLICL